MKKTYRWDDMQCIDSLDEFDSILKVEAEEKDGLYEIIFENEQDCATFYKHYISYFRGIIEGIFIKASIELEKIDNEKGKWLAKIPKEDFEKEFFPVLPSDKKLEKELLKKEIKLQKKKIKEAKEYYEYQRNPELEGYHIDYEYDAKNEYEWAQRDLEDYKDRLKKQTLNKIIK